MKNKKIGTLQETRERKGAEKQGQVIEYEEDVYDDDNEEPLKEGETRDIFLSTVQQKKERDPLKLTRGTFAKRRVRTCFLRILPTIKAF